MAEYANCTEITAQCPVEATVYGYYPDLATNAFFCGFFFLVAAINLFVGVYYKTWTYCFAMVCAGLCEGIGYIGRIIMNDNPWSSNGFIIQITCIIIGPAFNSAAIYLTLKYVVLRFGPQWSRVKPHLYTWIFIVGDIISLILQAAGGGMAASAEGDVDQTKTGNDIAMAGIAWQVFTLSVFGVAVIDYVVRRARARTPFSPAASMLLHSLSFRLFAAAMTLAWLTIFIRCIYRIIEFAGGWRNSIMQNELDFIILEGGMIAIAMFCQTAFHPGWGFPPLSARRRDHFVEEEPKIIEDFSSRESLPSHPLNEGQRF